MGEELTGPGVMKMCALKHKEMPLTNREERVHPHDLPTAAHPGCLWAYSKIASIPAAETVSHTCACVK